MAPRRPEVTRLSVKDELRFQAWAHRNGITDVDHPDSHYDYRGYWRSVNGADHQPGTHFPDTFKQHGHPTFSVESKYSTGPNDGGHWQGDTFIPSVGGDQRIRQDILPDFRPRNRAGEIARSLAFRHPALAGILSGTGNVAKGVATFIPETLKSLTSYTPEELRDPTVRQQLVDMGRDPDQMLHEALRARGRGEPVGPVEGATALAKGTLGLGFNLQRAIQGGQPLYERTADGQFRLLNTDVSPRERSQAITEMLGNTGLLALGVRDKSLPISDLPLSEAARAAKYPQTLHGIRTMFRNTIGGDEPLPRVKRVDVRRGEQMASVYDQLQSNPNDPQVRQAYDAFTRETQAQADALKRAGYSWEFTKDDPYPPSKGGSKAMLRDLRDNKHIRVYETTGEQSHPLMTNAQNNLFRAVHEILGHGVDEVSFNAHGEENAYRSHAQMYSPLARQVLATETRGQNSWFNFGPGRDIPATERPFAQQKAALWPTEHLGDYSSMPVPPEPPARYSAVREGMQRIDQELRNRPPGIREPFLPEGAPEVLGLPAPQPERIAAAAVKGIDGRVYTGLHHADAADAAAEAIRANPESRALANNKFGGAASLRSNDGFVTNTGRFVTRAEAKQIAQGTGQIATQYYNELHSSDLADVRRALSHASEHHVPNVGTDMAPQAPAIITPRPAFDPTVGAPQLSEMARYGRPESGSILDPIAPGTLLRDVPQEPMTLPGPKDPAEWQRRFQQASQAFSNPMLQDFLERGAERNYPWWYNAEPILANAIEHLGPELGMERFKTLMRYMKPTSIQTSPEFNLRNAGYQFWRTGHPEAPRFIAGMRPLYPTIMEAKLAELERGGGRMDPLANPKIEPYGEDFLGNWATHAGDTHFWRAMGALGLDIPLNRAGDPVSGLWADPVHAALTNAAHEAQGIYLPDVIGRSPVAPFQATMWGGAGDLTGVRGLERARPTIWQMFEDAAHRSAQHLGMTPNDLLGQFWRREHPLF